MKLIIGLGNPGDEYKNTRHNIGFTIIDSFLGNIEWKKKWDSLYYMEFYNGEQIIFIKPLTYMNLSGVAISKFVKYYNITPQNILVIQDDIDMNLGTYKVKKNSSSGGHNGIKSIINELNTDEFLRLKIGMGRSKVTPVDKYVLGNIPEEELKIIMSNKDEYIQIIKDFINNK